MIAVRIFMHKGFMRTKLRNLFSTHADAIGISDYRENKDNISTNIWMECECEKENIEWFLNEFSDEYYNIYNNNEDKLTIKIFKEEGVIIDRHDSL